MSFLRRIFNKRQIESHTPEKKESDELSSPPHTKEFASIIDFTQALNSLLMADKFLARSDYKRLIEDYAELNLFFQNQKAAKTLAYYCSANSVPIAEV